MKYLGMLLHADDKTPCGYILVDDFWDAEERRKRTEMCSAKHKWWVTGPENDWHLKCCAHDGDADCHIQCPKGWKDFNTPAGQAWSTKTMIHELKIIPASLAKILAEDDAEVQRVLGWHGNSRMGRKWDYVEGLNR